MWLLNSYEDNQTLMGSWDLTWFVEGPPVVDFGGGGPEHEFDRLEQRRKIIEQDDQEVVTLIKAISRWL